MLRYELISYARYGRTHHKGIRYHSHDIHSSLVDVLLRAFRSRTCATRADATRNDAPDRGKNEKKHEIRTTAAENDAYASIKRPQIRHGCRSRQHVCNSNRPCPGACRRRKISRTSLERMSVRPAVMFRCPQEAWERISRRRQNGRKFEKAKILSARRKICSI